MWPLKRKRSLTVSFPTAELTASELLACYKLLARAEKKSGGRVEKNMRETKRAIVREKRHRSALGFPRSPVTTLG